MTTISELRALEILDSRGRPTVKTTVRLSTGETASASVPSGRSTGSSEALELRDGDKSRYAGLGCRRAVSNVNTEIARAVVGSGFESQAALDQAMLSLDGTPNKSRLGANAILSVSIAFARATALHRQLPLYRHFASVAHNDSPLSLPRLTVNLFSGGKHAGQHLAIQDVLVVPVSAKTVDESLAAVFAVYDAAAKLLEQKYGQRLLRADEGGLSPAAPSTPAMLDDAVEAIGRTGLTPGRDVALAIDVASTHFHQGGLYHLDGKALSSDQMIGVLHDWAARYPILSFEDGLSEEDWNHWGNLVASFARGMEARGFAAGISPAVMGDDFLCTNPRRIRRAIETGSANALLLKVNQIGTLTEAAEALRLARESGWQVTVSARSGETEDNWLADLAVGFGGDFIKIGSITQSERLAKYNRLLEIEHEARFPLRPLARGN